MVPNILGPTGVLYETDSIYVQNASSGKNKPAGFNIVWKMVIFNVYFHIVAVYGLYAVLFSGKLLTILNAIVTYSVGMLGITAGAHRLYSHRAYKAKWPLRLLLTIFHTIAFQDTIINMVRDHRLHHKYNDTDADPFNNTRGFFFAHIGWMFLRKHPEIKLKGLDYSDVNSDPILKYQEKYYFYIMPLLCFFLPTYLPMYLWNETFINAFSINMLRYVLCLNNNLAVNSVAHRWGNKPYEKSISPTDHLSVAILTLGEGWHNYHHTFPWDYRTAELGIYNGNLTTLFINLMAKIGWAYDLKMVSEEMIMKRVLRTGDGSHKLWGWGDGDQSKDEINDAIITHSNMANYK